MTHTTTKGEKLKIVAPPRPTMVSGDFSTAGHTNLGLSIQYFADILYTIYRDWRKNNAK